MNDQARLREKTATLARMLNLQGTIGMFGHVSIRVPGTDICFISPGASTEKSTVRPVQIFTYNIDGTIVDHPGGLIPLEWRIHTQIHRDRPDVMCVCHLHAPHARAIGIVGKPLVPVFLHGSFLGSGVPTWNNPRLVVNDDQASDLSHALGHHQVAQMRGHGSVVVGATAEEAFFACTFMEENAQIQLQAEIAEDERVDWIGTPERLNELLEAADVLLVSAPLTRSTYGLIGAHSDAYQGRAIGTIKGPHRACRRSSGAPRCARWEAAFKAGRSSRLRRAVAVRRSSR